LTGKSARGSYPREVAVNLLRKLNIAAVPIPNCAFSSSGWPMRVLGPVVQISALSVLDAGKKLALRNAVTPQLVGHDHPWHVLQALQQPSEAQLRQLALGSG
jgi:hypothetical protein